MGDSPKPSERQPGKTPPPPVAGPLRLTRAEAETLRNAVERIIGASTAAPPAKPNKSPRR